MATERCIQIATLIETFLSLNYRQREGGRYVIPTDKQREALQAAYGTLRARLPGALALPQSGRNVRPTIAALDALPVSSLLTKGQDPQQALVSWYSKYIYPDCKLKLIVNGVAVGGPAPSSPPPRRTTPRT